VLRMAGLGGVPSTATSSVTSSRHMIPGLGSPGPDNNQYESSSEQQQQQKARPHVTLEEYLGCIVPGLAKYASVFKVCSLTLAYKHCIPCIVERLYAIMYNAKSATVAVATHCTSVQLE
jgi:hypothetical protein